MTIGQKIKRERKRLRMTQTELGDVLGVQKNAVSKWETGRVDDIPTGKLRQLAALFEVPLSYLVDDTLVEKPEDLSPDGRLPIAEIYEALNDDGRSQLVRFGRFLLEQPELVLEPAEAELVYIRHYLTPAAAGYASPIEGEDYEDVPRTADVPAAADFAVSIAGDSMEPYIHDGDTVYVQRDAGLRDFEVGIFFVDGDVYCKQLCTDAEGNLLLLSANPAREDANIIIPADSGRSVACFGKVLLPKRLPKPIYW